ncbi:MAG: hypothetical protein V4635_02840 [Bacteroidota bacterium]
MIRNNLHKIGLLLFLSFPSLVCFSQNLASEKKIVMYADSGSAGGEPDLDDRPKNNIFLNISGDASVVSLNYERLFFINPEHFFIAAGVGGGANLFVKIHADNKGNTDYSYEPYLITPHHLTFNVGRGRSFLELGAGGAMLFGPNPQPYFPYVMAGYRVQPWKTNRVLFRIYGCYPLESLDKFEILYVPVGLSLGWSF